MTIPYGGDFATVTLEQRFSVGIASPWKWSKSSVGWARLVITRKAFKVFRIQRLGNATEPICAELSTLLAN